MNQHELNQLSGMSFFHPDGLIPSWKLAAAFAGQNGHNGTMSDVFNVRFLLNDFSHYSWNSYFTTNSAEYFGTTKSGHKIIIVAHGVGPMSTLDGCVKAYSHHFNDKTRSTDGGRISIEEFYDLESGKYGPVFIVDYEEYIKQYQFPLIEHLKYTWALSDKLLAARLGVKDIEKHIAKWLTNAREYLLSNTINDQEVLKNPHLIKLGGSKYSYLKLPDNLASANLLSVSSIIITHLHGVRDASPMFDIDIHDWHDGTRFFGVRHSGLATDICKGVDIISGVIADNFQKLLIPCPYIEQNEMHHILRFDLGLFTEVPKIGDRQDTHEIHRAIVGRPRKIGKPVKFSTTGGTGTFFFRYGLNEIKQIAPPNANAYYFVSDVFQSKDHDHIMVQFYKIDFDKHHRIMTEKELLNDYDKLISIL